MKRYSLLLILGALFMVWGDDSRAARTTRDLVFDDEEPAQTQAMESSGKQTTALKTTMLLKRDGTTSTVLPSHEFKSGDSVKLVFTPNIDGYVYWLAKGSSGNYSVLFPSKANMDNAVQRNQEYTIPPKGTFRFDDTPGNEELLCILSAEKLPDMDKAIAEADAAQINAQSSTQLAKLEDVRDIKKLEPGTSVTRELILVKIKAKDTERQAILSVTNIFHGKVVDVTNDSMVIELTGHQDKLDAFMDLLQGYEILELARTGITGLTRGSADVTYLD